MSANTEKITWVEFRDKVRLKIAYLPRPRFKALVDESTIRRLSPETKMQEQFTDPKRLMRLFVNTVIKDWDGVTLRVLSTLTAIDTTGFTDEQLDQPIGHGCAPAPTAGLRPGRALPSPGSRP